MEESKIEAGLTHESWIMRRAWVKRTDFTPTPEQVERGFADMSIIVRMAWAERMDFTPSFKQIESGLNDEFESVREVWIHRLKAETDSILINDDMCISI